MTKTAFFKRLFQTVFAVAALSGMVGLPREAAPQFFTGVRASEIEEEIASSDRDITAWVLAELEAEIQRAAFAYKHSENPYVRRYAEEVIRENLAAIEKWSRWAPETVERAYATRSREGAANGPPLHRDLQKKFNTSFFDRLESQSGQDFARTYFHEEFTRQSRQSEAAKVLAQYATPRLHNEVEVLQETRWRRLHLIKEQLELFSKGGAIATR